LNGRTVAVDDAGWHKQK